MNPEHSHEPISMGEATKLDDQATLEKFKIVDEMAYLRDAGEAEGLTEEELRAKAIEHLRVAKKVKDL